MVPSWSPAPSANRYHHSLAQALNAVATWQPSEAATQGQNFVCAVLYTPQVYVFDSGTKYPETPMLFCRATE